MSMLQVVHLLLQFAPFTDSVRYNLQLVACSESSSNRPHRSAQTLDICPTLEASPKWRNELEILSLDDV